MARLSFLTDIETVGYGLSSKVGIFSRGTTLVCYGSLADISERIRDVRFTPKSGHAQRQHQRPLSAISGHLTLRFPVNVRIGFGHRPHGQVDFGQLEGRRSLLRVIGCRDNVLMWSGKKADLRIGRNPMQPLPPQLELPEGDRFTLPTVSAVRELVPPGGQLPAHMVLMMICGKELWFPLDREIARQLANILAPFRE